MLQSTTVKPFGDSLSAYKTIDFVSASSPEELRVVLSQIRVPYSIVTIYAQGSNHIAWIVPARKITKVKKKEEV